MAGTKYDPVEIAQMLEVFESMMHQTAPIFHSYLESLENAGFDYEQALSLTQDFHRAFWQTIMQPKER